jgi:hypothetical protein
VWGNPWGFESPLRHQPRPNLANLRSFLPSWRSNWYSGRYKASHLESRYDAAEEITELVTEDDPTDRRMPFTVEQARAILEKLPEQGAGPADRSRFSFQAGFSFGF